jgi:cellulose synthase/poly-beta-1,6-N-acetylglucosamine synthase-like glycosyltransferase
MYPCISIVVISHNEERNIGECLKSLYSLDYPKESYEIMVVDSSEDRTKEIITGFAVVRLISSARKEFSIKRNIGIKETKYELIAFIDADCIVPPDLLKKLVKKMDNDNVAAVACNVFPPPDSPFLGKLIACLGKPAGGAIGFDSYFNKLERGIDVVGSGHTLFKKSVLLEVNGFSEDKRFNAGGEDWDISQRIVGAGYILEYEPNAFIYHKTREFRSFFAWSYRHGVAQYLHFRKHDNMMAVFLSPFSLIWPLVLVLSLYVLPPWMLVIILMLLMIFILTLLFSKRVMFRKAPRRLKLLIQRRKRIGINMLTIFFLVIPLNYVHRLIMNFAQAYSMLSQRK